MPNALSAVEGRVEARVGRDVATLGIVLADVFVDGV